MAKQYLQPLMMFPAAAGGTCAVYIYNTTTKAALYNPNTLAPIINPVSIDSAGVVDPFVVESGITYDIDVMDSLGNSVWSAERISVADLTHVVGWQLGETPETAYRGDRGKTAYDHALSQGNPHGTTATDLGLGTVLPRLDALYHGQAPIQSPWRSFPMQNDFKTMELFTFTRSAEDQETIEFGLEIWASPDTSPQSSLFTSRCTLVRVGDDGQNSQWRMDGVVRPIWHDNQHLRVELWRSATHSHVYLTHHGSWAFPSAKVRITDLSVSGNSTVELSTNPIQDLTDLLTIYGRHATDISIWQTSDKGIFSTLEDLPAVDEELNTYTTSLHWLLQQVRSSLKWVRLLLKSHAARHTFGGEDQVSVDTRQIGNMTSFARTLVDDATAAEARATLGAAAESVTLSDSAASTTPPTAGVSTPIATLIQQIRNYLVGIPGRFISKAETAVQYLAGTLWAQNGGFISERSSSNTAFGARVTGDSALSFAVSVDGNVKANSLDKKDGTDNTPLTGNVQAQINGLVSKSASAILNGGTVDYWGKVFEITGMGSVYNRGEFTIAWKLCNDSYYQGELQINVIGSDASPQISLIQLGYTSTVMFTAVRNGTTWEIWAKQVSFSYNALLLQILYADLSTIAGFSTTTTAASVSGTSAVVYRYMSQTQSDSALALVPSTPIQITTSQTVVPVNGACYAINSTAPVNLIFANTAALNVVCYVYSTRPTNQNDAPHTLTASNPSGITQTWSVGIGGMSQSANQSGLMCIKMSSGYMVIGGMGNS